MSIIEDRKGMGRGEKREGREDFPNFLETEQHQAIPSAVLPMGGHLSSCCLLMQDQQGTPHQFPGWENQGHVAHFHGKRQ